MIHIERLILLPMAALEPLVRESEEDGFRFLRRLVAEWSDGRNRFDQQHEGFWALWKDDGIVAVGGLNEDPFASGSGTSRLRHFYVRRAERRKGFGQILLATILREAAPAYKCVVLKTESSDAAAFYEKLGFHRVTDTANTTHRMILNDQTLAFQNAGCRKGIS